MEHDHRADHRAHAQRMEGGVLVHPLAAARRRAAALREIRDAGESPVTLLVLMAEVISFVTPIVAFVIFIAFVAAHYAG